MKPLKAVIGVGFLVGTIALGSTLAASINLNNSGPVEFGQGIAQTTACDNDITITPFSTFVNEAGAGSYKFTSLRVSEIDSTSEKCSSKTFVIKAYGDSGILNLFSYTDTANPEDNETFSSIEIANDGGEFTWVSGGSDGDDVIPGPDNGPTETSFTLSFTSELGSITRTPLALAEEVTRITIESKVSTETVVDLNYQVGDRGPGGGIVFYVSAANFTSIGSTCNTTCKYLEVAPSTWRTGTFVEDINTQWSDNTSESTGQDITTETTEGFSADEKLNWKIGQGFYNTSVMKVSGATSVAQAAVLAYAGGSTAGQWFIPSMNELNELCKYARGLTTGDPTVRCNGFGILKSGTTDDLGGFVGDYYWSSSEFSSSNTWFQKLDDGYWNHYGKSSGFKVRPIRAF